MSKHDIIGVLSLDDTCLFHVGSQFRAHELHNSYTGDSQSIGHIFNIEDVGLYTIETRLLLEGHLWHFVSVMKKIKCERGPDGSESIVVLTCSLDP